MSCLAAAVHSVTQSENLMYWDLLVGDMCFDVIPGGSWNRNICIIWIVISKFSSQKWYKNYEMEKLDKDLFERYMYIKYSISFVQLEAPFKIISKSLKDVNFAPFIFFFKVLLVTTFALFWTNRVQSIITLMPFNEEKKLQKDPNFAKPQKHCTEIFLSGK